MAALCLPPGVVRPVPDDDDSAALQQQQLLLLQCCVCGQLLHEPLLLDCLHDCCRKCAGSLGGGRPAAKGAFSATDGDEAWPPPRGVCPVCKEAVDVTRSRLDLFIASRLRALAPSGGGRAVAECDSCAADNKAGQVAQHRCDTCTRSLCGKCLLWHNKFYKRHSVVALEAGEPAKQQNSLVTTASATATSWQVALCEQHRARLDFFCFSCQLLQCPDCGKACIEARHDITAVEGPRADGHVAQLRESISTALAAIADKLATVRSRVEAAAAAADGASFGSGDALSRLEADRKRDLNRLRCNKNAIAEAVQRAYERAEEKLRLCYVDASAEAEAKRRRDETLAGVLRYSLMYSRALLDEADNAGLLHQRQPLLARLQALTERVVDEPAGGGQAAQVGRCVELVSQQPADMESVILQWIGLSTVSDSTAADECTHPPPPQQQLPSAAASTVENAGGRLSSSSAPADDEDGAKSTLMLPSAGAAAAGDAPGADPCVQPPGSRSPGFSLLAERVTSIASTAERRSSSAAPLSADEDADEGGADTGQVRNEAGPASLQGPTPAAARDDADSCASVCADGYADGWKDRSLPSGLDTWPLAEDGATTNGALRDDGEVPCAWSQQHRHCGAATELPGELSGQRGEPELSPVAGVSSSSRGGSGAGVTDEPGQHASIGTQVPAGSAAAGHAMLSGVADSRSNIRPQTISSAGSSSSTPHVGLVSPSASTVGATANQSAASTGSSDPWWQQPRIPSSSAVSTPKGSAAQTEANDIQPRGQSQSEPRAAAADARHGAPSEARKGSGLPTTASAANAGGDSDGPPPLEGNSDDSGSSDIEGADHQPPEAADTVGEAMTYDNFIDEESQQNATDGDTSASHSLLDERSSGGSNVRGGHDVRGGNEPAAAHGSQTAKASAGNSTAREPKPPPTDSSDDGEADASAAFGFELVNNIPSSGGAATRGGASALVSRSCSDADTEPSVPLFSVSRIGFKLSYDCVDVAYTAEGSLLLAAGVEGLLELDSSSGKVLSEWLPPYVGSWLGSAQPLEDGRVAVGLPTSPYLIVLRRHDAVATAWAVDQTIALHSQCIWRLASRGSTIAASCTAGQVALAGGPGRSGPGHRLLVVSAVGGIELSLELLYPVWGVALGERVVVALSSGPQPMSGAGRGNETYLIDAYGRDDGELCWRHGSAERVAGACISASDGLLYVSLPDSHRVMAMSVDGGHPLRDVLGSTNHWLDSAPAWLSLLEKPSSGGNSKGSRQRGGGAKSRGSMAVLMSDRRGLRLYPFSD